MKINTFKALSFILYSLILAILVTAYMDKGSTYLLNFYLLPILFGAYYFNIYGAAVLVVISIGFSVYFLKCADFPCDNTMLIIQSILFSVVGMVAGVFQLKNNKLNRYLLHESLTDKLTGLYNYGHLKKRLTEELSRAKRYKHSISLVMIDIDDFKAYNDTYGHENGNKILCNIAEILTESKRESDVLFRYGGEEFCLILPETGKDSIHFAERIRKNVEDMETPNKTKITISVGVAYMLSGEDKDIDLIEKADELLYRAKNEGKNRVCV